MVLTAISLIAGLAALYYGAEWLVRGAGRIAVAMDISPLVIGLTVVAFGTSAPEMVAGAVAAWNGTTDIVLGNVFGSNIANIGLILGISAVIRHLPVESALLRREVPVLVVATGVVYALAHTGEVGRVEGSLLFLGLVGFTWLALRWARSEPESVALEYEQFETGSGFRRPSPLYRDALLVLAGLVGLTAGAQLLVNAAVELATALGVSEFLISVTMVAIGTSLPELATCVVAALRGEADVLVGNIVGSNIFNLLGALGIAAVIRPLPVAEALVAQDLVVVLLFTAAMTLALVTESHVRRYEGLALLAGYAAYIGWLVT